MLNEGGLFVLGAAPIPSVSALGSAVLQPRMKAPFVYDPKAPVCQPLGCQGRCRGHLDVTVYGDTAGERGQEQDEAWAAALHCRYRYQRRTQGQVCVCGGFACAGAQACAAGRFVNSRCWLRGCVRRLVSQGTAWERCGGRIVGA